MRAALAASLSSTTAGSTAAAPAAGSGAAEFGRTATIGVPLRTRDCTMMAPPKMDCSATGPDPSSAGVRSTASVSTPEEILTASRPAISLPSGVAATRTAAGDAWLTRDASTSAAGATT